LGRRENRAGFFYSTPAWARSLTTARR